MATMATMAIQVSHEDLVLRFLTAERSGSFGTYGSFRDWAELNDVSYNPAERNEAVVKLCREGKIILSGLTSDGRAVFALP